MVGVRDHEEADGEVPEPPRVPQEDLGQPGVPQVHHLGHGEGLEGWNLAWRGYRPLEIQWTGQWWSSPDQTWPGPAQSATGPSSGAWGGARRLKFGMQVVMATRNPVTSPMVVRAGPNFARASPGCHRSIFWGMGRGLQWETWMQ